MPRDFICSATPSIFRYWTFSLSKKSAIKNSWFQTQTDVLLIDSLHLQISFVRWLLVKFEQLFHWHQLPKSSFCGIFERKKTNLKQCYIKFLVTNPKLISSIFYRSIIPTDSLSLVTLSKILCWKFISLAPIS